MTSSWKNSLTVSAHFLHAMLDGVRSRHGEEGASRVLATDRKSVV